jgi:hypothetical protein
MKGDIHIAIVTHESGTTGFAAHSEEGLHKKLYEWVSEYWGELLEDKWRLMSATPPSDPVEAVHQYFEYRADHWRPESLEISTAELPDKD